MNKATCKMTAKKEVKNSVVYEPVAGTAPADAIGSSVYISKLALGVLDITGRATGKQAPQTVTLTLEY